MKPTWMRLAFSLVILTMAIPAAAQNPGPARNRLALLRLSANFPDEAWPEVEQRVAAELEVMGFDVVPFDARSFEAQRLTDELNEVTTSLGAFASACISFNAGAGIIRVWFDDEGSDRQIERRFSGDRRDGPDAVVRIGLAAAEILRAVLLEELLATSASSQAVATAQSTVAMTAAQSTVAMAAPTPAPPPSVEVRPAPASSEREAASPSGPASEAEPRRGRIWGAIGVNVPFDPLFAQALVTAGGGYRVRDWLSVDAELNVTVSPNDVAVRQDDLDFLNPGSDLFSFIYEATLTAQLTFHPWPRARAVRPAIGIGGGMFVVWHRMTYYLDGGDEKSRVGGAVAGIITASLRFDFPVSARGTVFVGATVGVAFPYIYIMYFGHRMSSVGLPLLETVVGFEWSLGRPSSRN